MTNEIFQLHGGVIRYVKKKSQATGLEAFRLRRILQCLLSDEPCEVIASVITAVLNDDYYTAPTWNATNFSSHAKTVSKNYQGCCKESDAGRACRPFHMHINMSSWYHYAKTKTELRGCDMLSEQATEVLEKRV